MDYTSTGKGRSLGNHTRPNGARPNAPRPNALAHPDQKARAPRQTLLIRAAKLVTSHGEFVCVIRDISETGIAVRLFHDVPRGDPIELHMPSGVMKEVRQVRKSGNEVAYQFAGPIEVDEFVNEATLYPKRGLRLALSFPAAVRAHAQSHEATVYDLSQQGARIYCDESFRIDQTLSIEGDWPGVSFGPTCARVRWRRETCYGLMFENSMQLREFARLAAQLQCPELLGSEAGSEWG